MELIFIKKRGFFESHNFSSRILGRRLIGKMVVDGEALKAGYGKYAHRDNEHLVPVRKSRKAKKNDETVTARVTTPRTPVTL